MGSGTTSTFSKRDDRYPQTILVLTALLTRAADWRYGYGLTNQIGLPSGTLYPVLMRLANQGLLDAEWHASDRPGAPARHAYRLTRAGVAHALASIDAGAGSRGDQDLAPA